MKMRGDLAAYVTVFGILLLVAISALPGQAQAGNISGTVRDTSGAVIPGASVSLANTATGVTTATKTDKEGLYVFPYVQPGIYDISASASGFETVKTPGVTVHVTERVQVSFELKIGNVTTAVTVTSEAPILQTADAVTGQVIDRTVINDLPLLNRTALDLAFLAPGVSQVAGSAVGNNPSVFPVYLVPNNFVADGNRNATSDVLIDGITTAQMSQNSSNNNVAYFPTVDAVQEFKVQETNFSAEYGFTGGVITNVITRSGTNSFHASAYDFMRNSAVNSLGYFEKQAGPPFPSLHRNVFGGTFGGPIIKDKTFFFVDYEGTRMTESATAGYGVPSTAEKSGDFGELCANHGGTFDNTGLCSVNTGQLWDPYTGAAPDPTNGTVRASFIPRNDLTAYTSPGTNLVGTGVTLPAGAGNLIDPAAFKLVQYYPAPNRFVGQAEYNPYFNYLHNGVNTTNNDQWDLKIDHHFNDRNMLSGKYAQRSTHIQTMNCFGNAGDPCTSGPQHFTAHLVSLDFVHTFSPTTVLSFSYGLTRTYTLKPGTSGLYPPAQSDPVQALGMPSYITASGTHLLPDVLLTDSYQGAWSTSVGTPGWTYHKDNQETHDLLASLTHIIGRHELKFGGEFRLHRFSDTSPGTPNGLFTSSSAGTSNQTAGNVAGGDPMASLMIGSDFGGWGQYEIPAWLDTQNLAWAGYLQDAFHASRKLTVNVGLRYDLIVPQVEKHNELSWLDLNAPSPLQVPGYSLHGGMVYASAGQRSNLDTYLRSVQPRIGLAYSLNDKTVIRTGYGIYYGLSRAEANANVINAPGFQAISPWNTTYQNNGYTPWGGLSNPFPGSGPTGGLVLPTGSSLGLMENVGQALVATPRTMNATPYTQSWSFGAERQLGRDVVVDAEYVGQKGTHLYYGSYNLNHIGPVEEQHIGDATWAGSELAYVNNPFNGYITTPGCGNCGPTIQQMFLDVPYPQFTSLQLISPPWANSIYQSLQLSAKKRFSNGLQFLVTYVWSKSIDNASSAPNDFGARAGSVIDPNNLNLLGRSLSEFNIPQVLQISYTYQLPFGRGKRFGGEISPVLNAIIGGWRTTGIWRFDPGQPLVMGLANANNPMPFYGQQPELTGTPRRNHGANWLTQYFANPEVFQEPASFTLGNTPRTLSSVSAPGTANSDMSLMKEFSLSRLREGANLEYRLEFFNAFNHPQFGGPNTSVPAIQGQTGQNPQFGTVTNQVNLPRQIQMALKLNF